MQVAQVAPLFVRIPPERYGGTERFVHALTKRLARRGHEVTLFGCGGFRTSGELYAGCRERALERFSTERMVADHEQTYERVLEGELVAA